MFSLELKSSVKAVACRSTNLRSNLAFHRQPSECGKAESATPASQYCVQSANSLAFLQTSSWGCKLLKS